MGPPLLIVTGPHSFKVTIVTLKRSRVDDAGRSRADNISSGVVNGTVDYTVTPLWSLRAGRGHGRDVLAFPLAERARAEGRGRAGGGWPHPLPRWRLVVGEQGSRRPVLRAWNAAT
jgi:hypothetical protein